LGGRWLVARAGALGDFVMTIPVIAAVRAQADHLTVACRPRYLDPWPGLADRVIDIGGVSALWLFGAGSSADIPDAAVVWSEDIAQTLGALGTRIFTSDLSLAGRMHARLWEAAPVSGPFPAPSIRGAERWADSLPPLPERPVVLAPGSGGRGKRWHGFAAVAKILASMEVPAVWLPGRDEGPLDAEPSVGMQDLRGVCALAARSGAWLGNDTGTSHLAAASGARVSVMFGPTDPARWCPPGATALDFAETPRAVAEHLVACRG